MTPNTHPLYARRKERGLSQQALSEASGVERQRISRLERGGRQVVRLADLAALAKVLDTKPTQLLGDGQAVVSEAALASLIGVDGQDAFAVVAQRLRERPELLSYVADWLDSQEAS